MASNHHDKLFRALLSNPADFAALVQTHLPPALAARLDLRAAKQLQGSFVDPNLSERHSDLLYQVPLDQGSAFVYVLFEHQSTEDPLMCLRLLIYMARIWDDWLRKEEARCKREGEGRPTCVPAILPLVLYQGPGTWRVATQFLDLIDLPQAQLDAIRAHLPSFRFVLENLAETSDADLRARGLSTSGTLDLLLMKHARGEPELLAILPGLVDLFNALQNQDDRILAVTYILKVVETGSPQQVQEAFGAGLRPEVREVVVTLAEKLRAEGRAEGQRRLLLRQLRARFGGVTPEIEARIGSASEAELETWGERFASATTLEEVFAA